MQPGPPPGPYAPPAPLPPAPPGHRVRPPLWWFAVAGGLALAGVVGAVVLWVVGVMRLTDTVDSFSRVEVPGTAEVAIDEPGGYSIYHERPGIDDGLVRSAPGVTVTAPSGDEVTLRRYTGRVTYDFGGHEGRGLYTFRAEEAGTYTVTTTGESISEIAVGPGLGRGIVAWVAGGFAVGAVGVLGGIVLAIVTGVRRSRNRRLLVAAGPPGGWGAPPGAGWGAPAAGGWGAPPAPPGPPPAPPGPPPPGGGWAG